MCLSPPTPPSSQRPTAVRALEWTTPSTDPQQPYPPLPTTLHTTALHNTTLHDTTPHFTPNPPIHEWRSPLLKRRTRTYTRKYQPAHSLSLCGTPPHSSGTQSQPLIPRTTAAPSQFLPRPRHHSPSRHIATAPQTPSLFAGGESIKKIRIGAERLLKDQLQKPVKLSLFVKVTQNWRKKKQLVEPLIGY